MITFNSDEIFDLNLIGLYITVMIALLLFLCPIKLVYLLLAELILIIYGYYLMGQISRNKNCAIFINKQNQWFVEINDKTNPINLKDYWFLKQYIFLWVKGKENSVSFVVTRSIIGAQKFSQLRALIK